MSIREALLKQIEEHCRSAGVSTAKFGIQAVRDNRFFNRLRRGQDVKLTSIEAAERIMRSGGSSQPPHKGGV